MTHSSSLTERGYGWSIKCGQCEAPVNIPLDRDVLLWLRDLIDWFLDVEKAAS